MWTTISNSPAGWAIYLVEGGIIRQRYPGRYRTQDLAIEAMAVYRVDAGGRELKVMPYDRQIPAPPPR